MEEAKEGLELIRTFFPDLSDGQAGQIAALGVLYREWNSRINLISRKDEDGLYERHVLHSLSLAKLCRFRPGTSLLDLGTGGGFPGIPLAIILPGIRFHLVDSIGKKIRAVIAIAEALNLKNITAEHIRAEQIRDRKFEAVLSRAVAPLGTLWTWSAPLLLHGKNRAVHEAEEYTTGLVCLKGGDLEQEIRDSGLQPLRYALYDLFPREYFRDKYMLRIPA